MNKRVTTVVITNGCWTPSKMIKLLEETREKIELQGGTENYMTVDEDMDFVVHWERPETTAEKHDREEDERKARNRQDTLNELSWQTKVKQMKHLADELGYNVTENA